MTQEQFDEKREELYNQQASRRRTELKGLKGAEWSAKFEELTAKQVAETLELYKAWWSELQVGDGVTLCYNRDHEAFTVIKMTAKTITVQRDQATLDNWKPKFDGGVCVNNSSQKWTYERDPEGYTETLRWSDKNHCYICPGCTTVRGRREFQDYNF